MTGRKPRRPERTIATVDHNVPTTDRSLPIVDRISKQQIDTLRANCREFGIRFYDLNDKLQGIVHVIGPELGYTQPGMTIVCGDSHTATHGAFGALAFGIGTSEVEHVLATQTLLQNKPKTLEIRVDGRLPFGVTAKDIILYIIGRISASGGVGYCIEYTGEVIRALTHGRADDGVQHVDRGRRQGRAHYARSNHFQLSPRPAVCTKRFRRGRGPMEAIALRSRGEIRSPGKVPRRRRPTPGNLGHQSRTSDRRGGQSARSGRFRRSHRTERSGQGLGIYGFKTRHADHRHQARSGVYRLLHQRPH